MDLEQICFYVANRLLLSRRGLASDGSMDALHIAFVILLIFSVHVIMLIVILPAAVAFDIAQCTEIIQSPLKNHFDIVYSQGSARFIR
jgi:hypothetical protein